MTRAGRLATLGALLVVASAPAACSKSSSGSDPCRGEPGTAGCECLERNLCSEGLACLSGRCVHDEFEDSGVRDSGVRDASRMQEDGSVDGGRRGAQDAAEPFDADCPSCEPDGGCGSGCNAGRVCVDGECVRPFCGDGVVMDGEQCDNGSANSPDAYGVGECTDDCRDAPYCGDAALQSGEQCDRGSANQEDAYGEGLCTTQCRHAGRCGDGARNGPEQCDGGSTVSNALGACNPECTGFYERKAIKLSSQYYATDLGGPSGADAKCRDEHGDGYKALLVGGGRRASQTPFAGDGQQDWVIAKYTYYYNADDALVWRTDGIALLGVQAGARVDLLAPAFTPPTAYPWSGYASDWTTIPEEAYRGTCTGWTSAAGPGYGSFVFSDLRDAAGEPCGSSSWIVCVEQ